MICAADLPGWVLAPSSETPTGIRAVAIWHNGALVAEGADLGPVLRGLGPSTRVTERVATAAAGLLTVPVDAGLALIAVPRTPAALAWRWHLVTQAVAAGYLVTVRPVRLLSCAAVWTYADGSALEPLWCTAAVAGIPLIWMPSAALAPGLPWVVGDPS